MAYKDILNTFGWDTSYADRFQAAALKQDTQAMQSIADEYKASTQWASQPLWDWNYWEDTERRQNEIVNNLNQAYEQDPTQFKDWSTFTNNFNYDYEWRSDKERDTMARWYNNKMWWLLDTQDTNNLNNVDYFFNQLVAGNQALGTWTAIDSAKNRYNNWKYLSWMTPEQISSAISSNALNPVWQEMQDLKQYSPALYAQVQASLQWQTSVEDINKVWEWIYNWLTSVEENWNYTKYDMTTEYQKNASVIQEYNTSLYNKILWLWWDTAAYVSIVASMLQNPQIQSSKNEVEDLEWEINKIQEQMYTIWDSVRATLWSEAPEDLVSAYISQQTKQLQNQLRTAQNSLLVAQWKLNNQLSEVDTLIDAINYWIKTYWEDWTSSWSSDYQFISGSKYQKAWYFNKKTWEFIPLGSTWTSTSTNLGWWTRAKSYDYQDDSDARLQEIANNVANYAKTNPELFKDRSTFNDYFNYNGRSDKQKQVLNAAWMKYGKAFWAGSVWWNWNSPSTSEVDTLAKAVKRDLLNNKIISFDATSMKKQYPEYWNKSRWQDASYQIMVQIWKSCTPDELSKLMVEVDDANDKALVNWYLTTMSSRIKKTWNWDTKEERNAAIRLIDQVIDYIKLSDIKQWLTDAWYSTKNLNTVMKDYSE